MKKQSLAKSLTRSTVSHAMYNRDNRDRRSTTQLTLVVGQVRPEPATRPWLDRFGQPLTLGRLKQRSKTWPLEVWQLYVAHLKSEETWASESRISTKTLEEELAGMTYEINECLEASRDFSKLHMAINSLSSVQRTIIQKVFWSGQTVREIAHEMKLSRSTVQDLKSAALTNLYGKIPDTSPFIRGEVVFLSQKEGRKRAA